MAVFLNKCHLSRCSCNPWAVLCVRRVSRVKGHGVCFVDRSWRSFGAVAVPFSVLCCMGTLVSSVSDLPEDGVLKWQYTAQWFLWWHFEQVDPNDASCLVVEIAFIADVFLVCVEANFVGPSLFLVMVVAYFFMFDSSYGVGLCCWSGRLLGLMVIN